MWKSLCDSALRVLHSAVVRTCGSAPAASRPIAFGLLGAGFGLRPPSLRSIGSCKPSRGHHSPRGCAARGPLAPAGDLRHPAASPLSTSSHLGTAGGHSAAAPPDGLRAEGGRARGGQDVGGLERPWDAGAGDHWRAFMLARDRGTSEPGGRAVVFSEPCRTRRPGRTQHRPAIRRARGWLGDARADARWASSSLP